MPFPFRLDRPMLDEVEETRNAIAALVYNDIVENWNNKNELINRVARDTASFIVGRFKEELDRGPMNIEVFCLAINLVYRALRDIYEACLEDRNDEGYCREQIIIASRAIAFFIFRHTDLVFEAVEADRNAAGDKAP